MQIENYLTKLKEEYQSLNPSDEQVIGGWLDVEKNLENKDIYKSFYYPFWGRRFLFVAVSIFIIAGGFVGLSTIAQAALPGEPLYPIKRVSESVVTAVTGNHQAKVDNRAEEIVGLSHKDEQNTEALEKTVEEYKQTVEETRQEINNSNKEKDEFVGKLKKHEQDFEEASNENSKVEVKLKEAIDAAQKGQIHERKERDKSERGKRESDHKNENIKIENNKNIREDDK